jgi:hypothetical protein
MLIFSFDVHGDCWPRIEAGEVLYWNGGSGCMIHVWMGSPLHVIFASMIDELRKEGQTNPCNILHSGMGSFLPRLMRLGATKHLFKIHSLSHSHHEHIAVEQDMVEQS